MADKKKVIVAMSGGIDSSVAAALLKGGGFYPKQSRRVDVSGVFMKFWTEAKLKGAWNRCCSPEAERRARWVAKSLGIPFYVFNFEKEFKKRIVDYFLKEYKTGKTPNPCVACNKEIKFGLLLEKALKLDADFIATGHYARIRKFVNSKQTRPVRNQRFSNGVNYSLISGKDRDKDQSYFLWQLNQKQLKHIVFPIGNYTKNQVRDLAKKLKLPVFDIPESQEICFIPKTVEDFLKRHLKSKPGQIMTKEGKTIGKHKGLWFYTIGQRKGIGLPQGPYYVLDKDFKKNILIVTKNEKDLYKKELMAKDVNWVSGKEPELPLKVKVKIRYRHQPALAAITKNLKPRIYTLKFERPQRAITAGQSIVFYSNQELLGGGIIS